MRPLRIMLVIILWLCLPWLAAAAEVSLSWDAPTLNEDGSPVTDLAGYDVHYGTSPGSYGTTLTHDTSTTAIVKELTPGVAYYFAVTAVDLSGNHSVYSNEVSAIPQDTMQTLVLIPTGDTFINLDNINYRIEPTIHTYTWPDQQVANAILMKFNLSALPTSAVLEAAALTLALVDSDPSGAPYRVSVHKVIGKNPNLNQATGYRASNASAWKANSCCYQKIPMAQANIGPVIDALSLDTVPGEKTWDVTALIEDWRATPSKNFGLLLNSDATQPRDRWRTFASREHPTAAWHPTLTLTYTLP
jgi:hypothetical protein